MLHGPGVGTWQNPVRRSKIGARLKESVNSDRQRGVQSGQVVVAKTVSGVIKLRALCLPKRHADSGPQQRPLGPLRRAGIEMRRS